MKQFSLFIFTNLLLLSLISSSYCQKLELVTQSGHSGIVWTCSFSPDGKILASGSIDGTVKLWDVKSGKELRTLYGHTEGILSLCFSPDGNMLAGGSSDGTVNLLSVIDGSVISTIKKTDTVVECLSFSSDGKNLAMGGDKKGFIDIIDIETGKEIFTMTGHSRAVSSIKFFRKGKILASGSKDGTIKLWDLNNGGKEISSFKAYSAVNSISLSADGKYLAGGCDDSKVNIWDISTGQEIYSLTGHSDMVISVSFSPDGKILASADYDKRIILWDRLSGKEIFKVEGFPSSIESVSFSPDGMILAIACDDNKVRLWDISTIDPLGDISSQIKYLEGKANGISSVTFSPDGKILACIISRYIFHPDYKAYDKKGKEKKSIILWDLETGKSLQPFEKMEEIFTDLSEKEYESIDTIVFSHDGKILAGRIEKILAESSSFSVKLWDIKTGKLIKTIEDKENQFSAIAFSRDDRKIATGCGEYRDRIMLYDVTEDKTSLFLKDLSNTVTSLSFSDTILACGVMRDMLSTNNITVNLLDIKTGKEINNFETVGEGNTFTVFSPDGKLLAAGSKDSELSMTESKIKPIENKVILIEADRGKEILQIEALPPMSFSPDGKILACSDKNNRVKLLDISTGKEILTLKGHSKKINSISFSPSGKIIATGGDDMKIKLWDIISGKEKGTIISTGQEDWAIIGEDYRFDSTFKGMKTIHFVTGNKPVVLLQLKDCYYEPGLLAKITGFNNEPWREVIQLKDLHFFPEIKVEPVGKDKKLTVKLFDQGGGIGKIQIYLNNKEIGSYEGKDIINIDLSGYSFLPGEKNIITIVAWNIEGYLSNGGIEIPWVVKGEE
jgi:WD40 repeat protein